MVGLGATLAAAGSSARSAGSMSTTWGIRATPRNNCPGVQRQDDTEHSTEQEPEILGYRQEESRLSSSECPEHRNNENLPRIRPGQKCQHTKSKDSGGARKSKCRRRRVVMARHPRQRRICQERVYQQCTSRSSVPPGRARKLKLAPNHTPPDERECADQRKDSEHDGNWVDGCEEHPMIDNAAFNGPQAK